MSHSRPPSGFDLDVIVHSCDPASWVEAGRPNDRATRKCQGASGASRLTALGASSRSATVAAQLADEAPTFFSYIISFVAVASIWYGHHESFKYIRRYDGRLIALNFGSLLLIAFLPFPTAVLGRNQQDSLAAVLYALTLAVSNLLFAATWWHASHGRRLVRSDLSPQLVRLRFYRTLGGTFVFLLSIPIALWQPIAAEIVWSVFLVALYVVFRGSPPSQHRENH